MPPEMTAALAAEPAPAPAPAPDAPDVAAAPFAPVDPAHPEDDPALPLPAGVALREAIEPLVAAHPGLTGLRLLDSGHSAFAARLHLAEAARERLDVQYYIFRPDLSGALLCDALRRAADRGVQVRVLLDDNNTVGLDAVLQRLDAHPRIEVRLFNPFRRDRPRLVAFALDFARLNRRMHNKSFTADGVATIVGGRNVGDAYFDGGADTLFVDLDALAVGPVVEQVVEDFERYWQSELACPAAEVIGRAKPRRGPPPTFVAEHTSRGTSVHDYLQAIAACPFVADLMARELQLTWAPVELVSDPPRKALDRARDDELLWSRLEQRIGTPERSFFIVSPYFVPGRRGARRLRALARSGVKVSVLTNSLAATDVAAVHAGYARWRRLLLRAGVVLHELRRTPGEVGLAREQKHLRKRLGGSGGLGSSAASLHAKTFAVDERLCFIGSFNFDPRSARLNTEMGFMIDSEPLAKAVVERVQHGVASRAWSVRWLAAPRRLVWEGVPGEKVWREDPETPRWKRALVVVIGWLPIEWLL